MKLKNVLIPFVLVTLISCNSNSSVKIETIAGAYAAEIVFDVPDLKTGKTLGIGKIRDTIFIVPKQNGFEISNKKWRSNDYDMNGWQNLRPRIGGEGAMHTYHVTYDPTDSSLVSDPPGMMTTLYLDFANGKLYKGKERKQAYTKVE